MALSDIITKIEKDAEAKSEMIREEARNEAAIIMKRAEEKASEIEKLGASDAERAESKARGRIVASATHEAKFIRQSARVALINRVFEESEKLVAGMDKETYRAFVTERAESLPEKEGALTVSAERKDETLDAIKKAGGETKSAVAAPILGGFILETETAVYDHSLATLLKQSRGQYAHEVANMLFGS